MKLFLIESSKISNRSGLPSDIGEAVRLCGCVILK